MKILITNPEKVLKLKRLYIKSFCYLCARSCRFILYSGHFGRTDFLVLFTKNPADHFPVGFHHSLRVDGGEIDLRGLQTLVPQPLADDGQADSHVPHRAGPAVPPDVCRERDLQSHHFADFLQLAVHPVFHPFVLPAFRAVLPGDDGQQVRASFRQVGVGVHDFLHGGFPADGDALPGLPAAVLQQSVPDVVLSQVCHVHERDALEVDAQHEHVPGEGKGGAFGQGQPPDSPYGVQRQGPFGGGGKAGEHVVEDVPVGGESLFRRLAVEGAQGAQVAGRGVALHAPSFQPCLIPVHQFRVQCVDGDVLPVPEAGEARQGVEVGLGGPCPAHAELFRDHAVDEAEPGLAGREPPERRGDVVRRVFHQRLFLFRNQ